MAIDEGGWLAGVLSSRGGRTIGFHAAEIMIASVRQLRRLPRLPQAFKVRSALRTDESTLGAFSGDPAKIARLLSCGDLGLLAEGEGRIQAMEWVRFGPAEYEWDARWLGVVFQVSPRYCWLHNGSGSALGRSRSTSIGWPFSGESFGRSRMERLCTSATPSAREPTPVASPGYGALTLSVAT